MCGCQIKLYLVVCFNHSLHCRNFDFLIPDAPELISNFLEGEQDMSCKRNAFMMLIHADQERALTYLSTCIDQVNSFGDILQLVIVELIYKASIGICLELLRILALSLIHERYWLTLLFVSFSVIVMVHIFLAGMSRQSRRKSEIHQVHLQSSKF